MTRALRRGAAGSALVLGVLTVLGACAAAEEAPPGLPAARPGLDRPDDAVGPVRIGVVVPPVEGAGAEFRPLVEGVRVAAYRFELGPGTREAVDVRVALDDGTAEGASRAVAALLDEEVAAVVLASPGAHTADAVADAGAARTAVLLPYGSASGPVEGAWSLAPSAEVVAARVGDALDRVGASRPYRATAADRAPGTPAVWTGATHDPHGTAEEVVALLEDREVDSVVVDAPAAEQAALVAALQDRLGARQLPVVLTPEAITPAFGDRLAASGSTGGRLLGVGVAAQDHAALTASETGARVAVFLTAVRLAAGDPTCRNTYDDDGCAPGAPWADVASHDAALAVVRAVDAAGTVDPAVVRSALAGLRLTAEDGLAGHDLDFGSYHALPDEAVVVLHAATADAGLRPSAGVGEGVALSWFAEGPG